MPPISLLLTRTVRLALLLLLVVVLLPLVAPTPTPVVAGQTHHVAPGHVPAGLSSSDWASIQAQIADPIYFKASNTEASDYFGISVAVDGNTVVVGAPQESSGIVGNQSDNSLLNAGAAYVFVYDGTSWSQQAYLKASNPGASDFFGFSVAISGDTIVVGAYGEDSDGSGEGNNSAEDGGATYVFVRNGTAWSQQAYLKASNTEAGDWFGYSVAISGDTIVVGANREDGVDNSVADAGAAYVFVRSGTSWSQQAYLKASNMDASDWFGYSVAISGDTIVVGAYGEDSNATGVGGDQNNNTKSSAGAAYVFVRNATVWSQEAYLKASNTDTDDLFGRSVFIADDTIVVGAYREDGVDNSALDAGAAYVFVRSGSTWSQQAYLKGSNTEAYDSFGFRVAISGDTIIVSAINEASNATGVDGDQNNNLAGSAGAAYVFVRSGSTWSQQAYLKASNTDASDWFGYSVAISGSTIVVGAIFEGSNATGVGGDQNDNSASSSGAAYLFTKMGQVFLPFVAK